MEALFYQFNKLSNIIIIFLILIITTGITLYFKVKSFKGTEKEIKLYGMLMGMNRMDIIILAMQIIQAIAFEYSAIVKQVDIKLYAVLLVITSGFYILYRLRSFLFEIINLAMQVVAMYLNKTLYQYSIETESNTFIQALQIILSTFMILYAIYAFITHLDGIIKQNKNVRRNTSEKK